MTVEEGLRRHLDAAAGHALTYPYKGWGFGEGPALLGLLTAARVLGRHDLVDAVEKIVAPTLNVSPGPTDHLIPVEVLTALARRRPHLDIGPAIDRFTRAVLAAERPVPDRPAVHRPDHPDLGTTVWVDCMHTDGPGLALTGHLEAAVSTLVETASVLQDESGLFCHGYDVANGTTNGVQWARGQGWALFGLLHVASLASRMRSQELCHRVDAVLTALEKIEVDGCWRTVVDDPSNPVENSLSPMVVAAVRAGIASGTVDPRWTVMSDRCLRHTLSELHDGALTVSAATPVGDAASYHHRPLGVFPWGQGPVLLALCSALGQPGEPSGPEQQDQQSLEELR